MPRILVLDDDAVFRKLATASLRARGHDIVEAKSGREADLAIAAASPDLVIVDGLLPDTDGFKWIARLRGRAFTAPIIFASAFWKSEKGPRGPDGANGFLKKPVTPLALLREVDRLLGAPAPATPDAAQLPAEQQRELEAMGAQYARDLPGCIAGLLTALEQLKGNPKSSAVLGVARRRAHNIAGEAGSFGFGEVGTVCAEIEEGLIALQQGGGWEPIAARIDLLTSPSWQ